MDELKYLVFNIGEEEYAFDIEYVKGIENDIEIVPMPNRPAYLLGIINLRGEVIPVLSLRNKFGKDEDTNINTKLIITSINEETKVAFKVDSVVEITDIEKNELHEIPNVVKNNNNLYIEKACRINKKLVIVIDLKNILEKEQINEINEIINNEQ